MEEIWKISTVSGKIKVSNLGNIISTYNNQPKYKQIKNGYFFITISGKKYPLHRLIAFEFVPLVDGKNVVNHMDCNKLNNRADNLEWCTHQENSAHAKKNGRYKNNCFPLGFRKTKLTESDIQEIRSKYKKRNHNALHKQYGISTSTLWNIVNYKLWKHI